MDFSNLDEEKRPGSVGQKQVDVSPGPARKLMIALLSLPERVGAHKSGEPGRTQVS